MPDEKSKPAAEPATRKYPLNLPETPFRCAAISRSASRRPLGLEYIGAALRAAGHEPTVADLRFRPGVTTWIRRTRPRLVGISCLHSLEYDLMRATAGEVRRAASEAFILIGGDAAAAFPAPLESDDADAICLDGGEDVAPAVAEALENGAPLDGVAGLRLRTADGWRSTASLARRAGLDRVPLPARDLVGRHRNGYHCLIFKPVWLVETARGCPFRCTFCSVWQLHGHAFQEQLRPLQRGDRFGGPWRDGEGEARYPR